MAKELTLKDVIAYCLQRSRNITARGESRYLYESIASWLIELDAIKNSAATMRENTLRKSLIILDRLNTTERIDVDREELIEAVKVVSAAAKTQLSVLLTVKYGRATDSSGNEIPVKQPCCPICGEAILNARQRRIKFCPSCGQKLSTN